MYNKTRQWPISDIIEIRKKAHLGHIPVQLTNIPVQLLYQDIQQKRLQTLNTFYRRKLRQCLNIHYPKIIKIGDLYNKTRQLPISDIIEVRKKAHLGHIPVQLTNIPVQLLYQDIQQKRLQTLNSFYRRKLRQCLNIHYPKIIKIGDLYNKTRQLPISDIIEVRKKAHLGHIHRRPTPTRDTSCTLNTLEPN